MKPVLLTTLLVLVCVGAVVFFRVSRAMGQDTIREPSAASSATEAKPTTQPASPLDFTVKDIDGKDYDLAQLKGKVVLIVNVASKCGLTQQYKGLEALYDTYKDRRLVIVGFPANNL